MLVSTSSPVPLYPVLYELVSDLCPTLLPWQGGGGVPSKVTHMDRTHVQISALPLVQLVHYQHPRPRLADR